MAVAPVQARKFRWLKMEPHPVLVYGVQARTHGTNDVFLELFESPGKLWTSTTSDKADLMITQVISNGMQPYIFGRSDIELLEGRGFRRIDIHAAKLIEAQTELIGVLQFRLHEREGQHARDRHRLQREFDCLLVDYELAAGLEAAPARKRLLDFIHKHLGAR